MAITTSVARGYAWRNILIGVVCLGMGLWGVYDYWIKIPSQQLRTDRIELLRLCKAALETTQDTAAPNAASQRALDAIDQERTRLGSQIQQLNEATRDAASEVTSTDELQKRMTEYIQSNHDVRWLLVLGLIETGLRSPRGAALAEYPDAHGAWTLVQEGLGAIGQVKKPASLDRAMQWLFISCLLAVPWCAWALISARRHRYVLDDDGTLHLPEGTWKADEIADVDMSRWMAKSIAWVVHRDGARVKLDDYKHEHLHRIIGSLASRLHPGEWDADARPKGAAGQDHQEPEPASTAAGERR